MLQTTRVSQCSLLCLGASVILSAPVCRRSFDVTDSFSAVIKTATLQGWRHTDAMFVRYVANSLLLLPGAETWGTGWDDPLQNLTWGGRRWSYPLWYCMHVILRYDCLLITQTQPRYSKSRPTPNRYDSLNSEYSGTRPASRRTDVVGNARRTVHFSSYFQYSMLCLHYIEWTVRCLFQLLDTKYIGLYILEQSLGVRLTRFIA